MGPQARVCKTRLFCGHLLCDKGLRCGSINAFAVDFCDDVINDLGCHLVPFGGIGGAGFDQRIVIIICQSLGTEFINLIPNLTSEARCFLAEEFVQRGLVLAAQVIEGLRRESIRSSRLLTPRRIRQFRFRLIT